MKTVTPYLLACQLLFLGIKFQSVSPKAAAHVAVRPSVLDTVKSDNNKKTSVNKENQPSFTTLIQKEFA